MKFKFLFDAIVIFCGVFVAVALLGFMTATVNLYPSFQWKEWFEGVAACVGIVGVLYIARTFEQQRLDKLDAENLAEFNLRCETIELVYSRMVNRETGKHQPDLLSFVSDQITLNAAEPAVVFRYIHAEALNSLVFSLTDIIAWSLQNKSTLKFGLHVLARYKNVILAIESFEDSRFEHATEEELREFFRSNLITAVEPNISSRIFAIKNMQKLGPLVDELLAAYALKGDKYLVSTITCS